MFSRPAPIDLPNSRLDRHMGGFSLVELLVAMLITLIATVVMFQVFSAFEGQRRKSVTGSDVQVGASLAQLMLAKDIKDAGFGINDPSILGCQAWLSIDGATPVQIPMVPLQIIDGGVAGSDTIQVVKAGKVRNPDEGDLYVPVTTSRLTESYAGDTSDFTVSSTFGFAPFDIVALVQGGLCAIFEVTAVDPAARRITHSPGTNFNHASGRLVDGAGTALSFSNSPQTPSQLFNLGRKLGGGLEANDLFVSYAHQNNRQLVRINRLTNTAQPIMDDVVAVQAQYGIDAAGIADGNLQIDTWTDAAVGVLPLAQLQSIGAVRVAVVVRGKQMVDKRQNPELCNWDAATPLDNTTPAQVGLANFWANPATPDVPFNTLFGGCSNCAGGVARRQWRRRSLVVLSIQGL